LAPFLALLAFFGAFLALFWRFLALLALFWRFFGAFWRFFWGEIWTIFGDFFTKRLVTLPTFQLPAAYTMWLSFFVWLHVRARFE
jgi:hypothetical protein